MSPEKEDQVRTSHILPYDSQPIKSHFFTSPRDMGYQCPAYDVLDVCFMDSSKIGIFLSAPPQKWDDQVNLSKFSFEKKNMHQDRQKNTLKNVMSLCGRNFATT